MPISIRIRQNDANPTGSTTLCPAQKILILPEGHGVCVAELPLEPDEQPAETEEQVSRFLHVCAPPHSRKLFAHIFID
jgi:hypothetical protein